MRPPDAAHLISWIAFHRPGDQAPSFSISATAASRLGPDGRDVDLVHGGARGRHLPDHVLGFLRRLLARPRHRLLGSVDEDLLQLGAELLIGFLVHGDMRRGIDVVGADDVLGGLVELGGEGGRDRTFGSVDHAVLESEKHLGPGNAARARTQRLPELHVDLDLRDAHLDAGDVLQLGDRLIGEHDARLRGRRRENADALLGPELVRELLVGGAFGEFLQMSGVAEGEAPAHDGEVLHPVGVPVEHIAVDLHRAAASSAR